MMNKQAPASAEAYVASLRGWRRRCVDTLRDGVLRAGAFDEVVKWGHLVYLAHGPVLLIRAEEERVICGFWRAKRLREIAPALEVAGKYEMGRIVFRRGDEVDAAVAKKLARAARALNVKLGDPTKKS